jgi:hypothetical protein
VLGVVPVSLVAKVSVVYPRRNIPANLPFVQRIQNLD